MKKTLLSITICLTLFSASACEICGCGVGNFYLGLLPHFKSKFFGIRYQYNHYQTRLANDATQFSNDYYKTAELWAGFNIGSKWQVLAFVPYHFNKQFTDDGINKQNALGDISVLVNYNLVHTRSNSGNNVIEQQIWIGGGMKLPTGKNTADVTSANANAGDVNWQSGTGSTDFLLNASYDININKIGWNTSANYKINTRNKSHYQYGNHFTANTFVYYKIRAMGIGLSPNIGLLYEKSSANKLNKIFVDQTGGNILLASVGMEINFKKIAFGANVQLPVSQNYAFGQTQAKTRGLVHITFAL